MNERILARALFQAGLHLIALVALVLLGLQLRWVLVQLFAAAIIAAAMAPVVTRLSDTECTRSWNWPLPPALMVALIYVVVGVVVLVLGTVLLKVVLAQSAQLMQRAPEYALKTRIGTPVWHGSGRRWSGSIYSTCSAARVSDPVGRKLVGPGVGRTSTRAGNGRGALRRRHPGPTFE